jgi:hypothetical protein
MTVLLNTAVTLILGIYVFTVADAQTYTRIWDTTLTPEPCRTVKPFANFMKCMFQNNRRCRSVTTLQGTNGMSAKINFILPFDWNTGRMCIMTPRLGEILDRRTRVKTATLSYSVIVNEKYDNIGFIKLPGLAGVRKDRRDLFDWECQGSERCDRAFSFRLQMHNDRRLSLYYYPPTDTRQGFCKNIQSHTDMSKVYTDACQPSMQFAHGFTVHSKTTNRVDPLSFIVENNSRKNFITLKVSIDANGFMFVDLSTRYDVTNGQVGRTRAKWFLGKDYAISSLYAFIYYGHRPERQPFNAQNQFITISDWSLTLG